MYKISNRQGHTLYSSILVSCNDQIDAYHYYKKPKARDQRGHKLPIIDVRSFVSIVIGGYKIKVKRPGTIIIIASDISRPQAVAPIAHLLIVIVVNVESHILYLIRSVVTVSINLNLPLR